MLVLTPDEAAHVEAEPHARLAAKPQRLERNAEFGGPSGGIARDRDVPDPVPVLIEGVEVGQLCIPTGTVGIRAEHECAAPVVEAVDEQQYVVVARQIGVPAQLRGANAARFAVVRAYPDVEGSRIADDLDDGALGRGLADLRLTLTEVA